MRRLFGDITLVVLIVVAIGGLVAFLSFAGDTASRVAVGLSVVAVVMATASYASNPDWEKVSDDIAAIRKAVDHLADSMDDSHPNPAENHPGKSRTHAALVVAGVVLAAVYHRSRR